MTDEPEELTYDEAVALLPDGDSIHTILNPGSVLLGADMDRTGVLKLLRESPRRDVTGPMAQSMGHGLAAIDDGGRTVFIETRQENDNATWLRGAARPGQGDAAPAHPAEDQAHARPGERSPDLRGPAGRYLEDRGEAAWYRP